MKAAVLYELGTTPIYTDFPEPAPENDQQVIVSVQAAMIKQLDLIKAAGKHYTHYPSLPTVVGFDGIGRLEDGRRIYAIGVTGMMAEKAIVTKNKWTVLPNNLDDTLAAALPNALVGSDAALRLRAKIKKGDVVLVNGATGSTGMMAVQVAKYHGAATVIATGRNPTMLQKLKDLGADEVISLDQSDEAIIDQLKAVYKQTPIDIVIDYLWGHPTELLLAVFTNVTLQQRIRIVAVGEMAGSKIALNVASLRSRDIELIGSGIGSLSPQAIANYLQNDLLEMFQEAAAGNLRLEVDVVPLSEVEQVWHSGQRTVLTIA